MARPTFAQYITEFQDWFVIDDRNKKLVKLLGYYCIDKEKFESCKDKDYMFKNQESLYAEKAILLIGNVGTGKTTLLKLMNQYLRYLKDYRQYQTAVIPNIADDFSERGRSAFAAVKKGNWLLDELCFINEKTGLPDREYAMHFGDKILVGEKLIFDRSNVFLETGWLSHFTTNANLEQLKNIYGERAFSRLLEMCNVLICTDTVNRRYCTRPHIAINKNDRGVQLEPPQKVKAVEEKPMSEAEMKKYIQESYEEYGVTKNTFMIWDMIYVMLEDLGYQMPDLEQYMVPLRAESPLVGDNLLVRYARKQAVAVFFDQELEGGKFVIEFPK